MGTIHSIHVHETDGVKPRRVTEATMMPSGSLDGDSHNRKRKVRRLLATDIETLNELGLAPGDLREQLTLEGVGLGTLEEGSHLTIGSMTATVLAHCAPCLTIGSHLRVPDAEEFRVALEGKRGRFISLHPKQPSVLRPRDQVWVAVNAPDNLDDVEEVGSEIVKRV